jgi:hypothetical protein
VQSITLPQKGRVMPEPNSFYAIERESKACSKVFLATKILFKKDSPKI